MNRCSEWLEDLLRTRKAMTGSLQNASRISPSIAWRNDGWTLTATALGISHNGTRENRRRGNLSIVAL